MTTILVLAVVYLFLANCVHRRRVRHLETLILLQQALDGDQPEEVPEGVVEPPSWTYTMN